MLCFDTKRPEPVCLDSLIRFYPLQKYFTKTVIFIAVLVSVEEDGTVAREVFKIKNNFVPDS